MKIVTPQQLGKAMKISRQQIYMLIRGGDITPDIFDIEGNGYFKEENAREIIAVHNIQRTLSRRFRRVYKRAELSEELKMRLLEE